MSRSDLALTLLVTVWAACAPATAAVPGSVGTAVTEAAVDVTACPLRRLLCARFDKFG